MNVYLFILERMYNNAGNIEMVYSYM